MSENTPRRVSPAAIVLAVVLVLAVVAGGFYQEEIRYYFELKGWDKNAPARTVKHFLTAGKQGDQAAADRLLSGGFQPLAEGGKWVGYSLTSNAGTMAFRFSELTPSGGPAEGETEFVYRGNGAANVTVPDAKGTKVRYRLEMREGAWKITEILGGRPLS